jgi:hypothetical protein
MQHRMNAFDKVAGVRRRRPFTGRNGRSAYLSFHGVTLPLFFEKGRSTGDRRFALFFSIMGGRAGWQLARPCDARKTLIPHRFGHT